MIDQRRPAAYSEVVTYWRGIKGTLRGRGLLRQKRDDGTPVVPCTHALVLPDRVCFILDMNRLAGISREKWLDRDLWLQIRATLRGRRTYVADSAGLALVVAREPGTHELQRLPKVVPFERGLIPDGDYKVTLGIDRRGPVALDLAETHRSMLIGGASGGGKTNGMQALLAQLMLKHTPDEVQIAVVDTKEMDFSPWDGLPHLFEPVARDLEGAGELVEAIEQERRRRKAVMVKAGVSDWRDLTDPFPLLMLVIDEAADFADTDAMGTINAIARKGRATGVSIILGTQYPTSRVIDPQTKANLTTAIAFQCRTQTESRVILDRGGAETLDRPGLALTFAGRQWRRVQVLKFDQAVIEELSDVQESEAVSVLSDVEAALVRYAVEELGDSFTVGRLYEALGDRISKRQINKRAKDWERRGWLTEPKRDDNGHPIGRQVTAELRELAGIAPVRESPTVAPDTDDTVTGMIGRDEVPNTDDKGDDRVMTRPESPTEPESPITTPSTPHYCPVTACRWNTDRRGACDYAQRGLRCGDPQWRDEWQEKMEGINGKD